MITWRKWQPTFSFFSFFSNFHRHSTQKKPQKPPDEVQIKNYEERTYEEYDRWLQKNEPIGQTCQQTPSIMKMMIRKSISLPLLKKDNPLLTQQIEEEEFWKQFDRREQIIQLMNKINNAIAEDSQTINITFVSNFRLKGRQLKDWKSYPPNQITLRDRKLWRLNIFGCIETKDNITTWQYAILDINNKQWKMNDDWRMIVTRRRLTEPDGKGTTNTRMNTLQPLILNDSKIFNHTLWHSDLLPNTPIDEIQRLEVTTEPDGTYGREPQTPDEPSGSLTWQNSKSSIHWFIFKNDSTLNYWHTHQRRDQPTLKWNKSGILVLVPTGGSVMTLFLLWLLLWTFEFYLILSYRYEDLLISWSYLLILSRRSYLDLLILSSDDDPRYVSLYELYIITYMHLTCLWLMSFIDDQHAFYTCCCATCFYPMFDMLWTYILHMFTLRTTHGH